MGCRESTLRSFYGVAEEGYLHSKVRGAHHYPASRVSFKITILISRLEWVIAPWSISMNSLQRPVLVSGRCAAWLDNVNKWSFMRTILKTHNHHLTVLKTPAAAGIISKVLFHIHHHLFLVFLPFGQFCLFNLHILNRLLLYLDININEHKLINSKLHQLGVMLKCISTSTTMIQICFIWDFIFVFIMFSAVGILFPGRWLKRLEKNFLFLN